MRVLMVLSDGRAFDGLRLALSLASMDEVDVRAFFVGEAVRYLVANDTAGGSQMASLLQNLGPLDVEVGYCGTSLDTHVGSEADLLGGPRRSSMQELAGWTLWADRVLTW